MKLVSSARKCFLMSSKRINEARQDPGVAAKAHWMLTIKAFVVISSHSIKPID